MIHTKRLSFIFLIFVLFLSGRFVMFAQASDYESFEVLRDVKGWEEALSLADDYHLKLIRITARGIAIFETSQQTNTVDLLARGFALNSESFVARPPWQRTGDPYLNDQYALEMMETIEAWNVTLGSSDVIVAIIDTGIDVNHDEFIGRISSLSYNAATETVGLDAVVDDHGHGTMVAGIIGAIKDNGKGIAGIAQNVQLLVIKANESNQGTFRDSALIEGIYYAVDQGADIINLSLGGSYLNSLTEAALEYAQSQGVLVIAAAGNEGTNELFYPAAFPTTLSISAVDKDRAIASYSNYGSTIDLSAPGTSIVTTARNNGYVTASGTSFAAPQIAGLAALLLSHFDQITLDEMLFRILHTAMDEGAEGRDDYYGYGIANTLAALTAEFVEISFETFDADAIPSIYVQKGEPFILPQNPSLVDHIFEGWFQDATFIEQWVDGDVPTENMTLYAKFNSAFHTVYFVTDGSTVDPIIVPHGEPFTLPISALEHHLFEGWTIDVERTTLYNPEPLLGDLTLYAWFIPIIYHRIELRVDADVYADFLIEDGTVLTVDALEKTGHVFDGWYLDAAYSLPFSSQEIYQDTTLYSRFEPIIYTITFVTEGSSVDPLYVPYGEEFVLPVTDKEDYTFIGWYLDSNFTEPYLESIVTGDLTLYARFAEFAHYVTFVDGSDIIDTRFVEAGTSLEPFIPEKFGYAFAGWFYDEALSVPYQDEPIHSDLILYASFELLVFTVTYYDYDGSILLQTIVLSGESVEAPTASDKPSTASFHFTFVMWSQPSVFVESDLEIHPVYEYVFRPESVSLNPGIDTINAQTPWNDSGITVMDALLSVVVVNPIVLGQTGRYTILYKIYLDDQPMHEVRRVVRLVEPDEPVIITLNPGITTLMVGSSYIESGAAVSRGQVIIIGDVDTTTPGIYVIIYRVEYDDIIYEKTRMVHVLSTLSPTAMLYPYREKKEGVDYVA